MSGPTLAQQLAAFAVPGGARIPDDVRHSVRQRVLDILGLAAAARPLQTSVAATDFVTEQGGVAQAHVVGAADAVPATWAAFANGVLAHSLDYDDTHLPSILHPSATVVPAALAVGELVKATGAELRDAVAVGLEVTVRIGMAGYDRARGNSTFFEHGQHATSICGAVGAAAAAARLLGCGERGIADAMAVAVSMASGVIEANRTGGTVKRLHCGWAAHAAVSAALLVEKGFTGPPTAFEGRFGFFEAFLHGVYDPAEITTGLGETWAVPGIFFKPYPANHFTHAGIDAGLRLRAAGLRPEQVRRATLGVATATVRTIGEPLAGKQTPQTGYQAQFSGPYTVTAALFGGRALGLGLDDFTDELALAPERRAVMARIDVTADADCDDVFPEQFPAVLRVETMDGEHLEERVLANRGGPARPLTDDELATKFRDNAVRGIGAAATAEVERRIRDLDDLADVGELLAAAAAGG